MKTIHLDAVGGIAGDMFVAALLDALPDLKKRVLADGAAVLPAEAGRIALEEGESAGIAVLRFGLEACGAIAERGSLALAVAATRTHDHAHHDHAHGDHDHAHDHPDSHDHHDRHPGAGSFRDMVARIERADLHPGTASHAVAILTIIAKAEAAIHKVLVEDVHFHEIADWDSLLDVTCAGSIAAALEGSVWSVSALPRGGGLVRTAHGLLPVPAPATAAILRGFDWRDDGISGERVTPTGAAILRHLVIPGPHQAAGRLAASGSGAGTKNLPGMPNILRALVFETAEGPGADRVAVIEFEVDDMTGEEIGVAVERLRAVTGVLDVSVGQRFGKKGRPVTSFHLLARPEASEAVAARCFQETSTIGLRLREERRIILSRENHVAGGIPVKRVERPGGRTIKAESDALSGNSLAERRALKRRAEADDG